MKEEQGLLIRLIDEDSDRARCSLVIKLTKPYKSVTKAMEKCIKPISKSALINDIKTELAIESRYKFDRVLYNRFNICITYKDEEGDEQDVTLLVELTKITTQE